MASKNAIITVVGAIPLLCACGVKEKAKKFFPPRSIESTEIVQKKVTIYCNDINIKELINRGWKII